MLRFKHYEKVKDPQRPECAGRLYRGSIRPVSGQGAASSSFEKVPAFLAPKNLKPFIPEELEKSMEAGISDHVWFLEEIVELSD